MTNLTILVIATIYWLREGVKGRGTRVNTIVKFAWPFSVLLVSSIVFAFFQLILLKEGLMMSYDAVFIYSIIVVVYISMARKAHSSAGTAPI